MGIHTAASYANLFMGHLEHDFLDSQLDKTSLWLVTWARLSLLSWNSSTVTILSTSPGTLSPPSPFLDINVHINHSQFRSSVHVKPTNSQQYLHYHSCHPKSTKRSILTPSPLEGITSVTILMTSTFTPPTSLEPSPPGAIQSLYPKTAIPWPPPP